jgi:N utilization substance protein A
MKTEFMMAIAQLAAEKRLPREVVLQAVEQALASAFRKDDFAGFNISVKILPATGEMKVLVHKTVVENPIDPKKELSLEEAKKLRPNVQIGDSIDLEEAPKHAGRIAAQTAKQVVLQRLREAEQSAVFDEFRGREGEVLVGVVQRVEPKQVVVNLGRGEALLPQTEQVKGERYRTGQRLRVYLVEAQRTARGPLMVVSRTHKNLLKNMLELEVPEAAQGIVEVKAISREAGSRSKVAVAARQPGVDPVGSVVGLRGLRIQSIVKELGGEKIDVVEWNPDPAVFIANALSPAQVVRVEIHVGEKAATVVVPDRQLSLAIGKEGQNARLAAKLTGWRIDIKSVTAAEAEKPPAPQVVEEAVAAEVATAVEGVLREATDVAVAEAPPEVAVQEIVFPVVVAPERGPIRFAEEILSSRTTVEKKKKKEKDDKSRPRKPRRVKAESVEEEEDLGTESP